MVGDAASEWVERRRLARAQSVSCVAGWWALGSGHPGLGRAVRGWIRLTSGPGNTRLGPARGMEPRVRTLVRDSRKENLQR